MFERSAQREESFTANPATVTAQVAPQRSEGVADIRVAFFDLTFLGESRKGSRLPGRDPASVARGATESKRKLRQPA
jgi:hypothetical protein